MTRPGGHVTGRAIGPRPSGSLADPHAVEPGPVGSAHAVPADEAVGTGPWRAKCGQQVHELRAAWTPGLGLGGGPWCPACEQDTGR